MTTQTFLVNSLAAYVGTDAAVVGATGVGACPDWGGSSFYEFSIGTGATAGLRKFNIDASGVGFQFGCNEVLQNARGSIGVADINIVNGGAGALTPDGTKLHFVSSFANFSQLAQVQTSDLTLISTFGTVSSTGPSDGTHIPAPSKFVADASALVNGAQNTIQEIDSIQLSPFGPNTVTGTLDTGTRGFGSFLAPGGSLNHAYIIGWSATTTAALSLYKLTTGNVLGKIGSITPANIDATWTNITSVAGCAYDSTDGNVIFQAQTTDAVTNKQYIIKVNALTAAVMWKVPIVFMTSFPWSFTFARINVGRFHYLEIGGGGTTAYHINTATGAFTTELLIGLFISGPQFSDDVTNSVISFSQYILGASPPQFVGATMGNGGNHGLTAWTRFWFAYPGNTYAATLAESASAVDVITAPATGIKLWLHEYGMDETGESQPVAIRSYFETPLYGGPRSSPPTDDGIAFQQLEPDIKQSGDMVVWVAGSWNARAGDYASSAALIQQNPLTPQDQLVGLQTSRRMGRLHIESYTLNGNYISGRSLLHVDKADMHKLGGTTTPLLTADVLPSGAANPPFTEVGVPLSDFLPPTT